MATHPRSPLLRQRSSFPPEHILASLARQNRLAELRGVEIITHAEGIRPRDSFNFRMQYPLRYSSYTQNYTQNTDYQLSSVPRMARSLSSTAQTSHPPVFSSVEAGSTEPTEFVSTASNYSSLPQSSDGASEEASMSTLSYESGSGNSESHERSESSRGSEDITSNYDTSSSSTGSHCAVRDSDSSHSSESSEASTSSGHSDGSSSINTNGPPTPSPGTGIGRNLRPVGLAWRNLGPGGDFLIDQTYRMPTDEDEAQSIASSTDIDLTTENLLGLPLSIGTNLLSRRLNTFRSHVETIDPTPDTGSHLPCPFWFDGCLVMYDVEECAKWKTHALAHFKDTGPPSSAKCTFPNCKKNFNDKTRGPSGNWEDKMDHFAEHVRLTGGDGFDSQNDEGHAGRATAVQQTIDLQLYQWAVDNGLVSHYSLDHQVNPNPVSELDRIPRRIASMMPPEYGGKREEVVVSQPEEPEESRLTSRECNIYTYSEARIDRKIYR